MPIFQKERELVDFSPNEPVIAIKGLNHYFGTGELKKTGFIRYRSGN